MRPRLRFSLLLAYLLPSFVVIALLVFAVYPGTTATAQISAQVQSQWTQPTAEELSMTSQPQVPGAAAVYLYREETTDDMLHTFSYYVRLKVLTEKGKEYANVRLNYASDVASDDYYSGDFGFTVTNVAGRTIHSDGTVIPFTGKPYKRVVEKTRGVKLTESVFTLPDVEVGSIVEYRYKMRTPDNWFQSPDWYVQQDMFVRKGYFFWKATERELHDPLRDKDTQGISWSSVLPPGVQVVHVEKPAIGMDQAFQTFELKVKDIAPLPVEDFMPPVRSFTYRVNFYYAVDRTSAEFWKNEGKAWAKSQEKFIGSTDSMSQQVQTLVAAGDSDTVKLQKIYAAIMAMDNTSYSREHDRAENKAQGLKEVKNAQDIWNRKSGGDDQLTDLFVALARSAGFKAYVMRVTNRDHNLFYPSWLTLRQLNDNIAIVVLDGKEQYYDPGQRYCPFGQMAWKHTGVQGLREQEGGGTTVGNTPLPPYLQSQVQRIGDLVLTSDGTASGSMKITWMGAPALYWRQESLRQDEEAMQHSMREWMEEHLPAGMEVKVSNVQNLQDYEKPLVANFSVHGPLGTATAKRIILPGQLFETNSKPLFPHPTRDIPIYFQYDERVIDAVRIKFPTELKLESVPREDHFTFKTGATYHSKPDAQATFVLMRRTYDLAAPYFIPSEYAEVRDFYNKIATDDQQPIILTNAGGAANLPATGEPASHDKGN